MRKLKLTVVILALLVAMSACGTTSNNTGPDPDPGGHTGPDPDLDSHPDLAVVFATPQTTSYFSGQTIKLNATVSNAGDADAAASELYVFLAQATQPARSSPTSARLAVPVLAPAADHDLTVEVKLPAGLAAGSHTVWLLVDGHSSLEQSEYANDWASFEFTVTDLDNPADCGATPDTIVSVPDPVLRALMLQAVRRDNRDSEITAFTCSNLANVTQLNVRNQASIGSLQGIQYLTGVTRLSFENTQFPNGDAGLLAGLTAVTRLTLNKLPELTDISFMSSMRELQNITVRETGVTSLAPMQNLTKLEVLWAEGNSIVTASPLGSLPLLRQVALSDNPLNSLGNLSSSRSITHLRLTNTGLGNLSGLAAITSLEDLQINDNGLSSIPDLGALPNLLVLNVSSNDLTSLSGVDGLSNLRSLAASYNRITDMGAAAGLESLEVLLVSHNGIQDITSLAGITGLKELNISNNLISDISVLDNPGRVVSGGFIQAQMNCIGWENFLPEPNASVVRRLLNRDVGIQYMPSRDYGVCHPGGTLPE